MYKSLLLISLLICFLGNVFAQEDYQAIQSEGDIPQVFITFTNEKIEYANSSYDKNQVNLSKEEYSKFNSKTNFYVDYLLKNGKIVFGTDLNKYVDKVGASVLQYFPDIKDTVQFYIVKSASVNAFTSNAGIIFINIGLIAQLENEAQLAYIIAHELIHYNYKHSLELYEKEIESDRSYTLYKNSDESMQMDLLLEYSRSQEMMADSLGFIEAFAKTKYSFDEALSVFDVLLYSNLPFDEIKFDTTFFDDENFTMNKDYILQSVDPISNAENYNDKNSTHPNIKKRRGMMIDLVTSQENINTAKFLVSEEEFYKLQKQARFEMSNILTSEMEYDRAFYNSYLLLRKYPDNAFLKKNMAYCLYAVAIFKDKKSVKDIIGKYKEIEGNLQSVTYFFHKVDEKTISALAVKFLWNYYKEYPEDKFMSKILSLAIEELSEELDFSFSMITAPPLNHLDSIEQSNFIKLSDEEYNAMSKYDKIRYDKKYLQLFGSKDNKTKTVDSNPYERVLTTESMEPEFKIAFETLKQEKIFMLDSNYASYKNKFILVNPIYFHVLGDKLDIMRSIDGKTKLLQSIKNSSQQASMNMRVLDINEIHEGQTDKFNDLALLNSWVDEYATMVDMVGSHFGVPWQSYYIEAIARRHDLKYLLATGMISQKRMGSAVSAVTTILESIILYQIAPIGFRNLINNNNFLYQVYFYVDLETNENLLMNEINITGPPSLDYLNNLNYQIMYEIKKSKDK